MESFLVKEGQANLYSITLATDANTSRNMYIYFISDTKVAFPV